MDPLPRGDKSGDEAGLEASIVNDANPLRLSMVLVKVRPSLSEGDVGVLTVKAETDKDDGAPRSADMIPPVKVMLVAVVTIVPAARLMAESI